MPSFNLMRHLSSRKNKDKDHGKTDSPKPSYTTSNLSPYATPSTPTRRPGTPSLAVPLFTAKENDR